jgi:hypothetical protein
MNPSYIYPILFFFLFIYIDERVHLPHSILVLVYIFFSIYFVIIDPIYGVLAAIILILYDRFKEKREGFLSGSNQQIPKTIYQTWHTKDLPPKMAETVEKLKRDNPEYTYKLFDDKECHDFIEKNFDPDVTHAYDTLIPGAFKADLWRYCVLYINGGFYIDIKFRCEPEFSLSDIREPTFYVREYNHKGTGLYNHIIYTGIIGSVPKNPVFMKCIRQIIENCKTQYYGPEHTSPTGPYLFASLLDPEDIENSEYAYYEENGVGYIRNIENTTIILSHYPEYRKEQKSFGKNTYWKDAWLNHEIYRPTG